jgi:hypothetical protein
MNPGALGGSGTTLFFLFALGRFGVSLDDESFAPAVAADGRFVLGIGAVDALTDVLEEFLDAEPVLGGHQHMCGVVLLGELLDLGVVNFATAFEVGLVAGDGEDDVIGGVVVEFVDPLLDLLEAFLGGDFVGDDGSEGVAVVDGGDGAVLLLSGGVLLGGGVTQMVSFTFWLLSSLIFFSR